MSDRSPCLPFLACPACRGEWRAVPSRREDSFLLVCDRCRVRVPVLEGFPMFTEREPLDGASADEVVARLLGNAGAADFHAFCESKRRRGVLDAYAAWQPFNESGRTMLGFVPLLREILRPGDAILDLSNRSGWTGEFLAGLFPGQLVLSAWEGNNDCLGYRGFREWLPRGRRAANLEILFFPPDQPLPLKSGSVRFVHGYDTLHHGLPEGLLPELLRIATPDAAMLFPHVHLRREGHEPGFERGGELREGSVYRDAFGKLLAGSGRRACVLGEATQFAAQKAGEARPLRDEPESKDYNGLVAVVPEKWIGRPLAAPEGPLASASVIVNPLFEIAPGDGAVTVTRQEGLRDMPGRHPVYATLIPAATAAPLEPRACAVLYWARRVATVASLAKHLCETPASLEPLLRELERRELIVLVSLSEAGFRLQRFHALLDDSPLTDDDDLPGVWRRAVERHGGRVFLVDDADGVHLTYAEADRVMSAMARRLRAAGVKPGDRIAHCAPQHVEGVLLFWAAAHLGACVAIIDVSLPPAEVAARIRRLRPVLLFASEALHSALPAHLPCPAVLFDPPAGKPVAASPPNVSAWLRDEDYVEGPMEAAPGLVDAPAAILFTSGTTGEARGVVLTHQALAHSGLLMARHFEWSADDVFLCPSDFHTMMSLRSGMIANVQSGASTVMASAEVRAEAALLAGCLARRHVTLLASSPPLLRQFNLWAGRIVPGALASLRRVNVAGSALTVAVRTEFERLFRVPVSNTYGMTETTGLCVGELPGGTGFTPGGIGLPVDALLRSVDAIGRDVPPGAEGELWIHSSNLFPGYFDDAAATAAAFSGIWYRTRDRVRLQRDGSCFLAGRMQDAIKNLHGEWVSVREVQEALDALPDLADSGVGAYTDGAGQEHLGAIVVPRVPPGVGEEKALWLDRVRRQLLERLGARRMPTRIVVRDRVPRNSNGKFVAGPEKEWLPSHE